MSLGFAGRQAGSPELLHALRRLRKAIPVEPASALVWLLLRVLLMLRGRLLLQLLAGRRLLLLLLEALRVRLEAALVLG